MSFLFLQKCPTWNHFSYNFTPLPSASSLIDFSRKWFFINAIAHFLLPCGVEFQLKSKRTNIFHGMFEFQRQSKLWKYIKRNYLVNLRSLDFFLTFFPNFFDKESKLLLFLLSLKNSHHISWLWELRVKIIFKNFIEFFLWVSRKGDLWLFLWAPRSSTIFFDNFSYLFISQKLCRCHIKNFNLLHVNNDNKKIIAFFSLASSLSGS